MGLEWQHDEQGWQEGREDMGCVAGLGSPGAQMECVARL